MTSEPNISGRARLTGTLLVVLAAIGFGLIPLFSRLTYSDGIGPDGVVFWRYALPGLLLLPFLPPVFRNGLTGWLVLAAGAGMAIGTYGYAIGIRDLDIALAALIFFSFPLFVILYRALIFRHLPSFVELAIVALVLLAVFIAVGPADIGNAPPASIALTFIGPAAYGAILLLVSTVPKRLPAMSVVSGTAFGGLLVAALLTLIATGSLPLPTSHTGWSGALGMAFLVGLLPAILLVYGAGATGPMPAAIAGSIELPVSMCVGWFVFAEPVLLSQLMGAVIILVAILISVSTSHRA